MTVVSLEDSRLNKIEMYFSPRYLLNNKPSSVDLLLEVIMKSMLLNGEGNGTPLQYSGHLKQRVDSLEKTDAGRDWGQEEKGTTEDEMAGWHLRLNGREFE